MPRPLTSARTANKVTRAASHVLVVHGPNLNLLGAREPGHYGTQTLKSINTKLKRQAAAVGARVSVYQSNAESDLIACIQRARSDAVDFIVINPAAFTHTSVALRDALAAIAIPFVEVHLSNVFAREPFRHHSYFSDIAVGVITGLGAYGYEAALAFALAQVP